MAQYVYQYVDALLRAQHSVRDILGTDIMTGPKSEYNINLTQLMLHGVIMREVSALSERVAQALGDPSVHISDAVWLDRLNHALDTEPGGEWPQWIREQISPSRLVNDVMPEV